MSLITDHKVDKWRASWAWSAVRGGPGLTVRRFRRTFELKKAPKTFPVSVSADGRYRLWVNGERVGRGPLKGTLDRYQYETYDVAAHLRAGRNVIAAEVYWFGENAPTSEVHSCRPGLLLQGPEGAGLDTPGLWRVEVDRAVQPDTTPRIGNALHFLGFFERVDARALPVGWLEAGFDDAAWEQAVSSGPADVNRTWGEYPAQVLFPRELPMLTEEPRRFTRTIHDHAEVEHLCGERSPGDRQPLGWTLPAGKGGEITLDAGTLTTGHPVFTLSGGAGRTAEIIYSECMFQPRTQGGSTANGRVRWVKEVRDDFVHGDTYGYQDTVTLSGERFDYEPLHWRTFWFIKVRVSAGPEAFALEDASYRFTTFPQALAAEYASSDPDCAVMFDLSWRTLQLCSHETYEDCPYYEQLQYVGDTRLEALCSMSLAGEPRLARRAVRIFRDSAVPSGLTFGRAPTLRRQLIPYFSLIWVLMVEDYWNWVGPRDRDFVRECLGGVDGVLRYFRERLRADDFTGPIEVWNMVDATSDWRGGEPPSVLEGGSTYLTGLFTCALDATCRLHKQAGVPEDAGRWDALAGRLRRAIRTAWSDKEGLYLEGPDRPKDTLSQHSQMMAILSGAASAAQTRRILKRLTTDPSLHRTKLMQSFYLARALEAAGAYDRVPTHVMEPWRAMLGSHLTTWCEYWPGRSDCHAWSSWPAHDFVTCILGVRPGKPGFEEIMIRPQTAAADWAKGSAPTPAGAVSVNWRKDAKTGAVSLKAVAPKGVPTVVQLAGGEPVRFERGGRIALKQPG